MFAIFIKNFHSFKYKKQGYSLKELGKRTLTAAAGIPLALLVIYLGGIYFGIAVSVLSCIILFEYITVVIKRQIKPLKVTLIFINFLIMVSAAFKLPALSFISLAFFVLLLVVFTIRELPKNSMKESLRELWRLLFGLIYISIPMVILIELRNGGLFGLPDSPGFVLLIFLSVWACDTAAYFIGKNFGKTKLAPKISPKKTVEGAVAGFFASVLAFYLFGLWLGSGNLPGYFYILAGVATGISGQAGDLFESYLKRRSGVKDSASILPGHGGFWDRFDAFLFSVPAVAAILTAFNMLH